MSTLTILAVVATTQPTASGGSYGGDGPPFPFLLVPLFWLLLLGGVATALVLGRRGRDRRAGEMAGERVLSERFAAGDIDETEYRSRRAALREKR